VRGAVIVLALALLTVVSATPQLSSQDAQRPDAVSAVPGGQDQARVAATGEIHGRVIRADTGDPLRGVRVEAGSTQTADQFTDANGRFAFTGLAPGRYRLTASRPGYVGMRLGQRADVPTDLGRLLTLAGGQILTGIELALPRAGVVAGRVVDNQGRPVEGAHASLRRWRWSEGRRALADAVASRDQTDDRGEFRLFGVAPGSYVLAIDAANPAAAGRIALYYPGVPAAADAQILSVPAGAAVSELTVVIPQLSTGSISGIVRSADGRPLVARTVDAFGPESQAAVATVAADGSYVFPSLPFGRYTLSVSSDGSGMESAAASVVLDGADLVVPLTLSRGHSLRGRFVFDASPSADLRRPSAALLTVLVPEDEDAHSRLGQWTTRADWTFEATNIKGRYRLRPPAPPGWFVKAIRAGNADVTDAPLDFDANDVEGIDVLLTQRVSRVTGTVTDARGEPLDGATVVVFAEDERKLWPGTRFLRTTRADATGRFTVTNLPPERYQAIAIEWLETGEETNPDTLARFRRIAAGFTLGDAESRTLDLRAADALP
jgi:protocatechuate 3,4-dioxygenase beta subunit